MMIRWPLLILLFTASVSFLAAKAKIPLEIRGHITDSRTGNSIEGAEISIEKNGEIIYSVKSNTRGYFVLKYEGQINRSDQLKVSVYKSGFHLKTYKPLLIEKEEILVNLERKKISPIISPDRSGLFEL